MKIYLDMDNVLCDFIGGVNKIVGDNIETVTQWNNVKAMVWEAIAEQAERFWADLKWVPGGKELFEGTLDYCIPIVLSGQPATSAYIDNTIKGKRFWLEEKLNSSLAWNAIIVPSKEKYLYALKGSVLISNDIKTISNWRHNGGIAVHHQGDSESTLNALDTVALLYPRF